MSRRRATLVIMTLLLGGVALAAILQFGRPGFPECCPDAGAPALGEPITRDGSVISDTLPNGLRYFIREKKANDNHAELWLIVNAGSVLEEDDQRGLAHAVEHMAIRATRRFPNGAADRYLESLGMRRGEGFNGRTTLDETEYQITIPADRPGAVDTSLAILSDVASAATFEASDARAEAGVVLEEWRTGRDALQRLADARHAVLFAGTRYAGRQAIGDTSVLRRFDLQSMRRFYEKWYRTDRMAIVAVGDFDVDSVKALVQHHFGKLARARGAAELSGEIPRVGTGELQVAATVDAEATDSRISIWFPRPEVPLRLRADFRAALIGTLWRDIVAARLDMASLQAGSPFLNSYTENRTLARSLQADVVSVTTMDRRSLESLQWLVNILDRLAESGVTRDELNEAATSLMRRMRTWNESGEASADLAREYVAEFLEGDVAMNRASAHEVTRDLLPTIGVRDIADYARERTAGPGAVVLIAATTDDAIGTQTTAALKSALRPDGMRPIADAAGSLAIRGSLMRAPREGDIAQERKHESVGVYEMTLANGIRVFVKPTSHSFNEVQLRLVAPGGASLAAKPHYPSAYYADAIVGQTGVGEHSASRLSRWLNLNSISFERTVSDDAIILEGSAEPVDLEGLFQLLHLHVTSPRADSTAMRRYRERIRSLRRDRGRDPDQLFIDTVIAATTGNDSRAQSQSARFVELLDASAALRFWIERMAHTGSMSVFVVGDIPVDRIRELARRYLATIPPGGQEAARDLGIRFPAGVVRKDVRAGTTRARALISFEREFIPSSQSIDQLGMVRDLIELALMNRLREAMGGTYAVHVRESVNVTPPARYSFTIDFDASPERVDALAAMALSELRRLGTSGPTAAEFAATRTARIRDHEGTLSENSYWLEELAFHTQMKWPLDEINRHSDRAGKLTQAELQAAASKFIRPIAYVHATLRPRARPPGNP
jgi:zinc protease